MIPGLGRVVEPAGVLPQAAWRLDPSPEIKPDETRVRVERLNLDAASFRQLRDAHGDRVRDEVLRIVAERGKMHNPVTGSGGMLIGVVEEVGPDATVDVAPGDRIATLVSLTLTPLSITDGLAGWDGRSEQVPCAGHAILHGRTIAAVLPEDLDSRVALAVLDVCGAPALTARVVGGYTRPTVAVIGASGKSGSLSLAAAKGAGAARTIGVCPDGIEAARIVDLADEVVVADARDPLAMAGAGKADVTVVCVDVPGCEHAAILATADGGTVVFFSMATSFPAAALGAEGLAADVTLLIGNGYVPGHARMALDLVRATPGLRRLFDARVRAD
ncbi:L-erythro-3,5-diaminohexanoate dehydrogenase [Catenuloplanes nepalensis]|uniref:L-erythro-3,5-diaminohexanoate dehydrogenase n=1 Tax=Catenuloplanes nepalensis TaxID=587533 RepID=A0ABT9MSK3_9ACTN|nr:L-erythro-3,5-diaminohexanoate dehydrogenase [Catenuloplanes nepalensis]MDP9794411.1 L-erythro-3,5-diaminohexanoate dehydrogenase [Catenuloplanes nepalensis]